MRRVNERWTLIGCWKASEQASAKRLVTVDGVVEKSKPRCSNRMIPTTLQGREIPNGTFLRDRDVTEMRRTPESRHFYREQLYNLIRSHRFDFLSSNRTFPSSFISVSLFLISLRVLFFFSKRRMDRMLLETFSKSALSNSRNCVLPLFKRNKLPTRRIVGWQSKRVVYRWIVKLRGFHAATRLHLEIRPLIARWRSSRRRGTIIMA